MKYRVELTKWACKDLNRLPVHIVKRFRDWAEEVEDIGLPAVRKIAGFHDEPLQGKRKGQRSVRLSRSYRAFYIEREDEIVVVQVIEVNKHEY